ncbi:MAG TPA: response regulator [Acetobacteraceae bacterium]|nr:response regulator [Acetobacteraceae bacterium]
MVVPAHTSVLVVDDSKTMIRIVCNLLRQIGFSMIDEATDGNGALDLMQNKSYGVVISDWNMEPMTGLKLLQNVRADEKLKKTPFIMVTAESAVDNVIAAKKAGVNDYIVKPFNAETLKSKLVNVLGHF